MVQRTRSVKVILASASPRRKELLSRCGLKYIIMPSHVDESTQLKSPSSIVKYLAAKKAGDIAAKARDAVIIGADTIVVLGREIIGKPKDHRDAARILAKLNGSYHKVYSGVAVIDSRTGQSCVGYEVSRVKMRKLSKDEINAFSHKHLDKAGAYAVQEHGDAFVEKIEGDYFNVVGLPLKLLAGMLMKFGVNLKYKLKV